MEKGMPLISFSPSSSYFFLRLVLLLVYLFFVLVSCFHQPSHARRRRPCDVFFLSAESNNNNNNENKGYKFGDISRFLAKQATTKINELTGKDRYEFGDLSRYLDQQAKKRVSDLTGQDNYTFGDLTRYVDSLAKEKVSNFTGKQTDEYQVGDISKEVVRRIRTGEYELDDVLLALRVLLSAGFALTPVASILPVKWLFDLVNLGLAGDVAGKVMQVLATSLDGRMKEALTGDPKYQLGDLSKRKIRESIAEFTGKSDYQFGDISKKISELAREKGKEREENKLLQLNDDVAKELEEWDRRFQQQQETSSS